MPKLSFEVTAPAIFRIFSNKKMADAGRFGVRFTPVLHLNQSISYFR
jgi:hypothetical protein